MAVSPRQIAARSRLGLIQLSPTAGCTFEIRMYCSVTTLARANEALGQDFGMCDVYTVGERCPLGCLTVILVKRATDGHVFAWCDSCGLAWDDPIKGTSEFGSTEL